MMKQFKMFMKEEEGASAVEYGLMVALIAAAIIITVQGLGTTLDGVFSGVDTTLSTTISSSGGTTLP